MIASLSTSHDLIRWLDDFRHFLAYSFSILNWVTNGSEQIIALGIGAVISYFVWPRLRAKVNGWMKHHTEAANAELHAKLDHIIRHHPDIPDFPSTKTPDRDSNAS